MFKLIEDSPLNYFKSVHTPRPKPFIAPPADGKRRGYHGVSRGYFGLLDTKSGWPRTSTIFQEEIVNLLPEKLNGNVYISQTEEEQRHHFADMKYINLGGAKLIQILVCILVVEKWQNLQRKINVMDRFF